VQAPDENDHIIDIRHPDEEEKNPLLLEGYPIHKIPFYNLRTHFQQLDEKKCWLLYCKKGVMSQLHAQYLWDEGFRNVKVFRPGESETRRIERKTA